MEDHRQERVEIPRPKYQHLNPPDDFEYPHHLALSINGLAADSWVSAKTFGEFDIGGDRPFKRLTSR